tara:strand:+ start:603 stop:1292 length:690 start_codon:yes stop_codon:yes gene_type:complete
LKVTPSQLQDLYAFTRNHYVYHYDLQTELVDHLANDIETIWQEQPNLSFEEARDQSFKKFGVFGFMDVVEQRQKAMNKRYYKYLLSELKQWFSIPKIIITATLFVTFFTLLQTSYAKYFFFIIFGVLATWTLFRSIQLNREFRKRKEISSKKWLLEELIFKQAGSIGIIFLSQCYNISMWSDVFISNTKLVLLTAAIFTLLYLVNYISFRVIPDKAEELLKTTYPEFSL